MLEVCRMKKVVLIIIILLVVACSAPVKKAEYSGYLSDYSRLKESSTEKNYFSYRAENISNYTKFIIDPVEMLYQPNTNEKELSKKELKDLQAYLHHNLVKALTSGDDPLTIVDKAGDNVARLRVAITQVKKTIGALNLTIYTKVTGVGLGGVSVEGELLDSITGEQVAAVIRWGSGSRVLRAGFKKTGDAEILLKKWSKELKKKLSQNKSNEK